MVDVVMQNMITNAMTVDVEDYLHVSAFEKHIRRQDWEALPCRVEGNTDRVLGLFADHDVQATFFMLGWVAERYPSLVRRIVAAGHELASHGYSHVRATQQTPQVFREDVIRTKRMLEDLTGQEIRGYRAASYSIGADNLWALEILQETGHRYSSSIYPIHHDLYGMPSAPRFAFYPDEGRGLLEIPVTTVELFNQKLPCGGGGYFRLLPYGWSRWAMRRVNHRDRQACIFYFHPWEIDPDQPRQQGIGLKTRVRHYTNLDVMEQRLRRLMREFQWGRMDQVFLDPRPQSI
jgi:polysaccharide deacetylase family protein (PEP-CTERM system associated)